MVPHGDPPRWSAADYSDRDDTAFRRSPHFNRSSLQKAVQEYVTATATAHRELAEYHRRLQRLVSRLPRSANRSGNEDLRRWAADLSHAVTAIEAAKARLLEARRRGQRYVDGL